MQLTAPATYSWVALAQGTMMNNANMFVVYSSADAQNVTLSPRSTSGHVMPTHNDAADVSLMEGSGIVDGRMVANVRCGNCHKWQTNSMSLQDSTSDWLYAHLLGSPIASDDINAPITQHDRQGLFQWDLTQASGGSGSNPFTSAATNSTSESGGQNSWTRMSSQAQARFVQAHGALASIAFVGILPTGAILVRIASMQRLAWIHGVLQIFGFALFIAAAGIGIFMATGGDYLNEPHAIIGLVLLVVLFAMPFLGVLHHRMYEAMQKRTPWSYSHIFTGRAAIVLGMVNGGLGLRLADAQNSATIPYGVLAGLVGVLYIGAIAFGELRRSRMPLQAASSDPTAHHESKYGHGEESDSGSSR